MTSLRDVLLPLSILHARRASTRPISHELAGEDLSVPLRGGFISQRYLVLDQGERTMLMSSCAALSSTIFNTPAKNGADDDMRVRAKATYEYCLNSIF